MNGKSQLKFQPPSINNHTEVWCIYCHVHSLCICVFCMLVFYVACYIILYHIPQSSTTTLVLASPTPE